MDKYLDIDEWSVQENGFHADKLRSTESIFSLGNGRFGQRGNFEEPYSSDTLPGSYLAGISFLDKTKVGWWKNGYPKFFSRIPNAPDWSGIRLRLIDEELNLAQWSIETFQRRLDLKQGISYRHFQATSPKGNTLNIEVEHITHMAQPNLCLIRYNVQSINYEGKISIIPFLNGDVQHENSNFNERMWNILRAETKRDYAYLWAQTKRENSQVCMAMAYSLHKNGKEVAGSPIKIEKEKLVGFSAGTDVKSGDRVTLIKYVSLVSSLYCSHSDLVEQSVEECLQAKEYGWEGLTKDHTDYWKHIWYDTDVVIDGDPEVQQGIRFNIFQLYQTYQGNDPRLNIGAKGFTGEKYGGNTYWNTELCCLPYFLLSNPHYIARNLLLYRANQLDKAIENARKLGFRDGAALYPMVTINGDECHNEWEITFEEIHRNGIIAYAIINYINLTGDQAYLVPHGLKVLIAICRFWSQRVSFSQQKKKFVLLGVTGPNEYENNVDNNWYTNYSCIQCLQQTLRMIDLGLSIQPEECQTLLNEIHFSKEETLRWKEITLNMYLPEDKEWGIFVQNDGYLDKELVNVDSIPTTERPINQHWSWDRILRSCFIKQSDVLLGLYLYNDHFDTDTVRRNYHFYEPKTVHESSLSPYVHCILAARIGEVDKAYELFRRATRLDLDDYNNEVREGLHITSMAGSWMALVHGFAGMRTKEETLIFNPTIPRQWNHYSFTVNFRERTLHIQVGKTEMLVKQIDGQPLNIQVEKSVYSCMMGKELCISLFYSANKS